MYRTKKLTSLSGFTLVELIIVITILAILWTIGFMSFNGYQSSARDSVRVSDMKNIETGVGLSIVRTWTYPTPDDSISYTGWTSSQIIQWYVWDRVSQAVHMNKTPLDPLNNNRYVYSISWDGKYYQLAATKENLSFTPIISKVYADTPGVMVRWNYIFDPSLPSLLVVSDTVNTNSWIFDPNVCFITDWWTNTITSNSWTCLKKSEMSLKNLDNSLVWYWDMETCNPNCTTSWSTMKDLSWNSNDGHIFWSNIVSTWSMINKWLSFSWDINSYVKILKDTWSILNNEEITVNVIFKPKITSKWWQIIWDNKAYWTGYCSNFHIWYSLNTYNPPLLMVSSFNNTIYFSSYFANDINDKFISVYFVRKDWIWKTYLNWNKIYEKAYDRTKFFPNSNPLIIWAWSYAPASVQTTWTIDDIKIYNRALSDGEILQQAKIVGF